MHPYTGMGLTHPLNECSADNSAGCRSATRAEPSTARLSSSCKSRCVRDIKTSLGVVVTTNKNKHHSIQRCGEDEIELKFELKFEVDTAIGAMASVTEVILRCKTTKGVVKKRVNHDAEEVCVRR